MDTFNDEDPDWETTAAGRKFNYKCAFDVERHVYNSVLILPFGFLDGYGKINVGKLVEYAETWKLVKPQAWLETPLVYLNNDTYYKRDSEITSSGAFITPEGVSSTYEVTQAMLESANIERLEHVTARVWIEHARRGDVEVELISPNGISSVLARTRRADEDEDGFAGWKFMSMKHWFVPFSCFGLLNSRSDQGFAFVCMLLKG